MGAVLGFRRALAPLFDAPLTCYEPAPAPYRGDAASTQAGLPKLSLMQLRDAAIVLGFYSALAKRTCFARIFLSLYFPILLFVGLVVFVLVFSFSFSFCSS